MLNDTAPNPPITPILRWMTAIESWVVFFSGAGLFFVPQIIGGLWPWELTPFNARSLGALYFTSLLAAAVMAWRGRWSPARVVTPMIFTFTAIVLVVSLVYLPRFTGMGFSVALWFVLYISIPAITGYHLWLYRRQPSANAQPTPDWLRLCLWPYIAFFMAYGLAMLVIPAMTTGFWPWRVDEFHTRMYSVGLITPALGCLLLVQQGAALEFATVGLAQVFGGVTSMAGVLMVDATLRRIDWTLAGSLAWFVFPALLIVVGGMMALHARRIAS
jgi:hypothetical protein